MDIEVLRDYCLSKPCVTEETPFGPDMKVLGKIFCLFSIRNFSSINLKCDPEEAKELRANYMAIQPGYHMSKKHWNTVTFDQDVNDQLILKMVDESYRLVVESLSLKAQQAIKNGL
jgi:predicted DNA-binding protein (MmcQ/YjbR family)